MPAPRRPGRRTGRRGAPRFRLRFGFVAIAMVLSVFGARLVQLQGLDPRAYAEMAAAEGTVTATLPAERGAILDRNGEPLAASVRGLMVVADPAQTRESAPELAKLLATRLDVDYFTTLRRLRVEDSRFSYIARRVPSTLATDVVAEVTDRGYRGIATRPDQVRDYPARDVAANLVGFVGVDEPLAGLEMVFDRRLAGTDGQERYQVGGGNRIPLGENTIVEPVDGEDLRTTIDRDLQWFTQRVVRQTVEDYRADSGVAVVLDSRTGEALAIADHPTFDATLPHLSPPRDRGSRAMSDVYEPGSVEKVLTVAALLDQRLVTPRTRIEVPRELARDGRVINDWWDHGPIRLTLTGVLAKSSNIGTVRAADRIPASRLHRYLVRFGLGRRTGVGVLDETAGILPPARVWTPMSKDRIAFGQSLSVNALQMTAAVNTIANKGVYLSPSLIRGRATTDAGIEVGTDTATARRVISPRAARQTTWMMERVLDPDDGVAPGAAVPGYRVAGKTGTAQMVVDGVYSPTAFAVSFAGFAPADDPRFTVYVVVSNPRVDGGGGSIAGPAFARIMSHVLRRYGVPPTGTRAPQLPVEW